MENNKSNLNRIKENTSYNDNQMAVKAMHMADILPVFYISNENKNKIEIGNEDDHDIVSVLISYFGSFFILVMTIFMVFCSWIFPPYEITLLFLISIPCLLLIKYKPQKSVENILKNIYYFISVPILVFMDLIFLYGLYLASLSVTYLNILYSVIIVALLFLMVLYSPEWIKKKPTK